jgi:hypothetical protein
MTSTSPAAATGTSKVAVPLGASLAGLGGLVFDCWVA